MLGHRRFFLDLLCALVVAAFVCVPGSPAQVVMGSPTPGRSAASNDDATTTKRYTISGTVVNSQTGEGVPHAMVQLGPIATLTDSNGSFSIEGIAAGEYGVSAQKPGYFDIRGPRHRPETVRAGPDADPVTISLSPEAVIYGRITDSDGLPVQHFNVQVMHSAIMEGRRDWQPQGSKQTDEDGYYRIAGLQPGTYLVVAGPSQMPSIGAMAKTGQQNSGYGQVSFPAAADNGGTAGIRVSAGQKISADMSVEAEPFYSITGTLNAPPGSGIWFTMTPRNNIHTDRGQAFMRGENNTFTINMIPRGDYIMHAGANVQGKQWNADIPLHVAGDISGMPVVLEPSVSIPIATRIERTQPVAPDVSRPTVMAGPISRPGGFVPFQPPPVQVVLRSIENPQQQFGSSPRPPQQEGDTPKFSVENVAPGTYKVEFHTMSGDLYVASANYGSTDLLHENLAISHYGGSDPIDITLRDDGGKVKVKLSGDEALVNNKIRMSPRWLIVPEHGTPYSPNSQSFSSTEGYTFGDLRPGSYAILAFDDIDNLEYTNPKALEPYMSKAAHVDLTANQEVAVTVELQKIGAE